jgi:ribosomal protein S18 acetylase RimI-like enzyme
MIRRIRRVLEGQGWKRIGRRRFPEAEEYLSRRELFCVSACARFLRREGSSRLIWGFPGADGSVKALILHDQGTLFPIFDGPDSGADRMSPPLLRLLKRASIHAVQGLRDDVLMMEKIMGDLGRQSTEGIDYELMALNQGPSADTLRAGPPGLSVRAPELWELEEIFPLQTAYEMEEVLPQGTVFNAAACRLNLKRILKEETVLVAELEGRIIAKANTSAASFTRAQIGGVFVHPSYRGLGIARRICAELSRILISAGWGVSLFVKKWNQSARIVYHAIGFRPIASYRITYY